MSSREKIFKLLEQHYKEELEIPEFIPGKTPVPVSGKFTDVEDLRYLINFSSPKILKLFVSLLTFFKYKFYRICTRT